jgi:hypothetical protein
LQIANIRRGFAPGAVGDELAALANEGIMASRNGNAKTMPAPRSKLRRESVPGVAVARLPEEFGIFRSFISLILSFVSTVIY